MKSRNAFAASLFALLLALLTGQTLAEAQPAELSVLAAIEKDGRIFFGGYLGRGYFRQPVLGVVKGGEVTLLALPGAGAILSVKPTPQGAVGFGFMVGEEWVPQAIAVLLNYDNSYAAFSISANASFYGIDGIALDEDELILTGYVYASRYAGDSDVLSIRLSSSGLVKTYACYGSLGYPDLPRRVLRSGSLIVLVGETWAYNVSQSDILVLVLDEGLRVKASYAVGGAGAETPEDAIVVDGDLVVVGTTTLDGYSGFAVRVSDVGGLVWLRSFKGFGSTFLVSVDYAGGVLKALGMTEVEEGVKVPVLLTLSEKYGWSFELSRVEVLEADNFKLMPVSARGGALFLWGNNSLFRVKDGAGKAWSMHPLNTTQLELLNHSQLAVSMERALHGWRSIPGIVEEKPCNVLLSVRPLEPTVTTFKWRETSLKVVAGEYKSKVELGTLVQRWLERNVPLLLLSPALVIFASLILAAFRRRRSYPKAVHVYR
ncbi:MAG: hypothetical protein QW650_00495 [Thermofilum sp.]